MCVCDKTLGAKLCESYQLAKKPLLKCTFMCSVATYGQFVAARLRPPVIQSEGMPNIVSVPIGVFANKLLLLHEIYNE